MIRVAILGATGYTALELIKILLRHPQVQITALTSRQEGDKRVSAVHPSLAGRLDLRLEDLPPAEVGKRADCVFSCLPHGVTADIVPELLSAGARVVEARAPLQNMFGYSTRLRSLSEGRATFSMQFHAYDTLQTA